jgi:riboflavin synthase alpha subunit
LRAGDRVNVEADLVGKYVQRLALPHLPSAVYHLPSA